MITLLFLAAMACNGIDDDAPILQSAIEEAKSSRQKIIEIPAGNCRMNSPIVLDEAVSIKGQGKSWSVLYVTHPGYALELRGLGASVRDLTIYTTTRSAIGIYANATNERAAGNYVIEDVWVTGSGTWTIPVWLGGHERTVPPIGLRTVFIKDLSIFNAEVHAFQCWGCVGLEWFGGGAYQAKGKSQQIVIGGPNSWNNYINANVDWGTAIVYPGSLRK